MFDTDGSDHVSVKRGKSGHYFRVSRGDFVGFQLKMPSIVRWGQMVTTSILRIFVRDLLSTTGL